MFASSVDGEITYYEELGVAPDASPEEIRDAFRLSVRLLHPDQQTDPQLKEIAERHMRKLNRIYAVLSDPDSRRQYDEVQDDGFSSTFVMNGPPPAVKRWGARLAWGGAIVVSAAALIWLASDSTPGVQIHTPDPGGLFASTSTTLPVSAGKVVTDGASQASRISELQSHLTAVIAQRDAALLELDKLRGAAPVRTGQGAQSGSSLPLEATEPRPALTMTELPSAPKPAALTIAALPRIERPVNRQLAGFWFYAKPQAGQTNKNESLYLPEFIEATITEDGGMIHGRYRSRFVIADQAISPDVNFTFTGTPNSMGTPNGAQCSCQWTGAGGAKGEITLKLTSDNAMRVDWIANEIGTQGLGSGTAVLTRRIE